MAKFKVGDEVRILDGSGIPNYTGSRYGMNEFIGKIGTITGIHEWYDGRYAYCIKGYGCYKFDERGLELVTKTQLIVIYRKGREVIALDKNTGKTGIARCCPEDTFDFETGAKLAFERLTSEDKPKVKEPEKKPYNGKIIFTKGDATFKTGHIYEIKDGNLKKPRSGVLLPNFKSYNKFYSIEDVKDYFTAEAKLHDGKGWSRNTLKFIEVLDD